MESSMTNKENNSVTEDQHVTDYDYRPLPYGEAPPEASFYIDDAAYDAEWEDFSPAPFRELSDCEGRLFCPVPSDQDYEPILFNFGECGLNRYLEESVCACCGETYSAIFAKQRETTAGLDWSRSAGFPDSLSEIQ
jgi:hypothetical protein